MGADTGKADSLQAAISPLQPVNSIGDSIGKTDEGAWQLLTQKRPASLPCGQGQQEPQAPSGMGVPSAKSPKSPIENFKIRERCVTCAPGSSAV